MSRGGSHVLVTGGAGFIGSALSRRLVLEGRTVLALDDFSNPYASRNASEILGFARDKYQVVLSDVKDAQARAYALRGARAIYHLATSPVRDLGLSNPRRDYEIHLEGVVGLLESLRGLDRLVPLFMISTHQELEGPEACSRRAAEAYVLEYSRQYGLPAVVIRLGCVYGPGQRGDEELGWIGKLVWEAVRRKPGSDFSTEISVPSGDSVPVLFIEDLVGALLEAERKLDTLSGRLLVLEGQGTLGLPELRVLMRRLLPALQHPLAVRPGPRLISNSKLDDFKSVTGWAPKISVPAGVASLAQWVSEQLSPQSSRALPFSLWAASSAILRE